MPLTLPLQGLGYVEGKAGNLMPPFRASFIRRARRDAFSSGFGPTLPSLAMQQVGSYLGYTGRDANVVVKAARDPIQSWPFGTRKQDNRDFGLGARPFGAVAQRLIYRARQVAKP